MSKYLQVAVLGVLMSFAYAPVPAEANGLIKLVLRGGKVVRPVPPTLSAITDVASKGVIVDQWGIPIKDAPGPLVNLEELNGWNCNARLRTRGEVKVVLNPCLVGAIGYTVYKSDDIPNEISAVGEKAASEMPMVPSVTEWKHVTIVDIDALDPGSK